MHTVCISRNSGDCEEKNLGTIVMLSNHKIVRNVNYLTGSIILEKHYCAFRVNSQLTIMLSAEKK